MTALDTLLKTILVANGYNLNSGSNVFWWRDSPLQISELPGILCMDTVDTTVRAIGQHEHALTIELIISLESSDTGATARQAIADVIKALGTNVSPNVCLGGYAEDINPPDSELFEVSHEGIRGYGVMMTFQIIFATSPFDPYTKA
ncbi:MAG: hypothetical protein ABIJ57_01310 [Pseudomonadota bacterium]